MFDIGFTEILVILVVALVVIGPERLPTVARTLGALLGRLNRYVNDVKADVQREMRLEEMKKLQTEIEQQAMSIERTVVQEMESAQNAIKAPVEGVQESLADVMRETGNALDEVTTAAASATVAATAGDGRVEAPANSESSDQGTLATAAAPAVVPAAQSLPPVPDDTPKATA